MKIKECFITRGQVKNTLFLFLKNFGVRTIPDSVLNYMSSLYLAGVADTLEYLQVENADLIVEEVTQHFNK